MTVMTGPASAELRQCVSVPVGTPPVSIDTNNDGNPEFYFGRTGNPTVCVDGGPILVYYVPQAGLCGSGCVYLAIHNLPAYVDAELTVSITYQYSDGTYGTSRTIDNLIGYGPGSTICIKVGGTGPC